ncbi:MAG: FecR family protein [Burkholderiales bacterium]
MRAADRNARIAGLAGPIAVGLALATPACAAEMAGRVLLAAGDVFAVRNGQSVRLVTGAAVEGTDLLRTGQDSHLHVRMTDESLIALKPDSALALERYAFQGRPDGTENAFMRLLKGGFRTVTGLIGRTNRSAYRVSAGPATIGIRGTAFTLALCEGGTCREATGRAAPDGLYGNVTEGQVTARNRVGEFAFSAGQTFFARAVDEGIRTLPLPPPFVADRLEGQRRTALPRTAGPDSAPGAVRDGPPREGGPREGGPREGLPPRIAIASERVQALRPPGDIVVNPPPEAARPPAATLLPDAVRDLLQPEIRLLAPPPVVITEVFNGSGQTTILPPVNAFTVAYPFPGGPFEIGTGAPNLGVFDAGNRLLQFTLPNSAGALAQGAFSDQGGVASGQTLVRWGRWDNAVIRAPDGVMRAGVSMLYFTFNDILPGAPLPALPTSGSVTYAGSIGANPLGFDSALPPDAISGSITGSRLVMDFTNRQATLDLSFQFDLRGANPVQKSFSVTGSATPISTDGRLLTGNLVEACSPSCRTPAYLGNFRIGLAGAAGYGLAATAGGVHETSGSFSATFVRVFQAPLTAGGAVAAPAGIPAAP